MVFPEKSCVCWTGVTTFSSNPDLGFLPKIWTSMEKEISYISWKAKRKKPSPILPKSLWKGDEDLENFHAEENSDNACQILTLLVVTFIEHKLERLCREMTLVWKWASSYRRPGQKDFPWNTILIIISQTHRVSLICNDDHKCVWN